MKTNDLRIGNYLYYKDTDFVATVELIHGKNHFDCRDEFGSFTPNNKYQPIPLTEEWLLNFGFEKIGSFKEWNKRNSVLKEKEYSFPIFDHKNINMYFYSTPFADNYFFYNGTHIPVNKMPNVHQIQNLYFALTGKELEVVNA